MQLGRPASVVTDEPDGVRVVDHHHGVVTLCQLADLPQGRHVAVHGEHTVCSYQPAPRIGSLLQLLLEVRHVPVVIAVTPRGTQPNTVDDGRVVQLVADDSVLLAEQRLEQAPVRVEARRVQDRVLRLQESREPSLELLVNLLGTADKAHARHAVAPAVECVLCCGDDTRVIGEAEVVVRAEIENLPAARHFDRGLLRRDDDALGLEEPRGADLLQLGAELVADSREHGGPPIRLRTK